MTALATLAVVLALAGPIGHTGYDSQQAEQATGHIVLCVPRTTGLPADGAYFAAVNVIGLDAVLCRAMRHWRLTQSRGPGYVAYAVWALGHELTHAEQYAAGRPFDEHEADCGGVAKFGRLRVGLGIRLKLRPPKIAGC
jgi:hypothetical protein